eukprot:CAMPEP_0197036630 /NCGR_PEP_ID=MMETSP1384-20130603/14081_1 /TAXON_ID=29189 /ORGANISM="Ammonia sp." /LENGTH=298 /DNA_ID=CAMNT_0042466827 /DNA_START=30 /DNA_END=926 /DNA_ORIENTATION=-
MGNIAAEPQKLTPRSKGKSTKHAQDISGEAFFVNYCQRNAVQQSAKHGTDVDIERLDERRVVFVSIMGLFRSWKDTPPYILHSCLVILPFDREWLQNHRHSKYTHLPLSGSDMDVREFMQFIRYKDGQGLAFWAGEQYTGKAAEPDSKQSESLIAPFWRDLSQRLTTLFDPIQHQNYSPLPFYLHDQRSLATPTRYGVTRNELLAEMYCLTLKHSSMQEIMYQSNPFSLNPMVAYCAQNVDKEHTEKQATVMRSPSHSDSNGAPRAMRSLRAAGFWMSSDYDQDANVTAADEHVDEHN